MIDALGFIKLWLNNGQRRGYNGCIIGLTVPPIRLPFQIAPTAIDEQWEPQFTMAKYPASKYTYPIFTGMSDRTYSFQLQWDAMKKDNENEDTKPDCGGSSDVIDSVFGGSYRDFSSGLADGFVFEISMIRAAIDMLKTPSSGATNAITRALVGSSSVLGSLRQITHTTPDISEPAPPLCIFLPSLDPYDWRLGYFSANVKKVGFDKHMRCTAIEADCKFIVTPDYVITTFEELVRELLSLVALAGARNVSAGIRSATGRG